MKTLYGILLSAALFLCSCGSETTRPEGVFGELPKNEVLSFFNRSDYRRANELMYGAFRGHIDEMDADSARFVNYVNGCIANGNLPFLMRMAKIDFLVMSRDFDEAIDELDKVDKNVAASNCGPAYLDATRYLIEAYRAINRRDTDAFDENVERGIELMEKYYEQNKPALMASHKAVGYNYMDVTNPRIPLNQYAMFLVMGDKRKQFNKFRKEVRAQNVYVGKWMTNFQFYFGAFRPYYGAAPAFHDVIMRGN